MTQNEVEIIGIITPSEWDSNGKIKSFILAAYDEEVYQLENYQKEKLLVAIQKQVKISGIIEKIPKSKKKIITIRNLQFI